MCFSNAWKVGKNLYSYPPLPEMRGHAYISIDAQEFELAHPINTDTPTTYMLPYYVHSARYEHLVCVTAVCSLC